MRPPALCLALACLVALAACENKPPRPKTAALAEQVKSALVAEAGPEAQALEVESNEGVVRIRGRVDSPDTRQRAHEAAKKVPGVKWVQNQISIAPSAPAPSAKDPRG
jgi:osmotically-inducible protein OsmY